MSLKTNQALYKIALDAIEELFTDMSVSKSVAIQNLEELKEQIETMIESLKASK